MVEEPAPSGKAAMTFGDDLTPARAEIGRAHPQALRCGVIPAVMEGASYRQTAARYGVSTSVGRNGRSASDTREASRPSQWARTAVQG
jgi:hypothetical protein